MEWTEKELTTGILKMLIDESDLALIPYDRMNELAIKVTHYVLYGKPVLETSSIDRRYRAEELERKADVESAAGNHGAALKLQLIAEDEWIRS